MENYCRFAKANGLKTLNVGYIMRLNTIYFLPNSAIIIYLRTDNGSGTNPSRIHN